MCRRARDHIRAIGCVPKSSVADEHVDDDNATVVKNAIYRLKAPFAPKVRVRILGKKRKF